MFIFSTRELSCCAPKHLFKKQNKRGNFLRDHTAKAHIPGLLYSKLVLSGKNVNMGGNERIKAKIGEKREEISKKIAEFIDNIAKSGR